MNNTYSSQVDLFRQGCVTEVDLFRKAKSDQSDTKLKSRSALLPTTFCLANCQFNEPSELAHQARALSLFLSGTCTLKNCLERGLFFG